MIYKNDCTLPNTYLEELAKQRLDGLLVLIRVLVNETMRTGENCKPRISLNGSARRSNKGPELCEYSPMNRLVCV